MRSIILWSTLISKIEPLKDFCLMFLVFAIYPLRICYNCAATERQRTRLTRNVPHGRDRNSEREIMKNRFYTMGLPLVFFLTLGAGMALGADAEPASARWSVRPLAEVARHLAPELNRDALALEDLDRLEQGLPYRFALPEEVSLKPDATGTWEALPSGRSLWRLRIHSQDVLSLNLGFTRFWLPYGARLLIYPATGEGPVLVYDELDNAAHGELWTSVLLTDEVVVELEVDPALRWQIDLELTSIGRGYRFFGEELTDKSGFCNIDVVCPEGDPWRDEIDTVGVYSRAGRTLCTGFMINNTAEDGTPYFQTAYHCDVRANVAPSVVVYWNYQSPECGQHGGGSLADNQSGSTLRAEYQITDVTLLELDEMPDLDFDVKYAGWDRSDSVPTSAVAIHHPSVDEKSISFENDPLTITSYSSNSGPGDETHLRVADWDLGTTEGGSSGSPLFDQNHYVVGQLHGGAASCNNDLPDWYARFHVSWTGGGTSGTRLSDWLDPTGSGVQTLDLYDRAPSSVGEGTPGLSSDFILGNNSPNPFNPQTTIFFNLPQETVARLRVYDMSGRLVRTLLNNGMAPKGRNEVVWNGRDDSGQPAASGIYFYRLEIDGYTETKRMALVK